MIFFGARITLEYDFMRSETNITQENKRIGQKTLPAHLDTRPAISQPGNPSSLIYRLYFMAPHALKQVLIMNKLNIKGILPQKNSYRRTSYFG